MGDQLQLQASIIIPVRNEWPLTRQCILSVRHHTPLSHEIILIDNGSDEPAPGFFHQQANMYVIRNKWNRGFAAAINQGLQKAKGNYLVWLNNDTLPSHRWLKQLIHVLEKESSVGLVGPVSNKVIPEQKLSVKLTSTKQIHRFTDRYNRTNPARWRTTSRLSGFCLVCSRQVFEKIGYLDERFGLGTYEDDDYCYRAHLAGYRCMVAGDTYVHHFGSQSFRKNGYQEFQKILKQNRRYYRHKWNRLPDGDS
ncbi:glycosyltransferase family 2 protein [Paenactinomyces guangxiensis]|uniref:Glycosyltransferase family 2 protein n=1 Tax=Paenactinomyces guangxiensis TaxID=1490290 RepID=A0A7W1WQZ4_9BACL|nr:glycosyltransferase family 2 protein [Paenactinomyces guangxiensis]MBA4494472.1 glycosyltransferase family 2 protein [Paenactinomyces guangxiensis]MBH8591473.1 glycosyltransferase family 2 protein [Paenactinomyces guangxiensis]